MGRSCATAQKYASPRCQAHSPTSPTPSPHGQPHPTYDLHALGPEHLLTGPKRRPRRQDVVDQHHTFWQRRSAILAQSKRTTKGRLTGRAGGACEGHAVLEAAQELGLDLAAPPCGQPVRQGLGRVEATAYKPSPMQRHRDEEDTPRRGRPPLGHPMAQGAAVARKPAVLRAMHHAVRVWPQPKTQPIHGTSHPLSGELLDRLAAGQARPSPLARRAHPCHLVGHQGLPTTPASTQSPSQIHVPTRCDASLSTGRVFCVRKAMFHVCQAL